MIRVLARRPSPERVLECLLILVCLGLAVLLHVVVGYKMVVLNLFYLPVVLAAFYLGRLRAGTLALFCVLIATAVAVRDLQSFAVDTTPVIIALSLTVWAAVMGLNAIIVGTLSDERADKMADLHDANLGVVEVLSRYLNRADPELQNRTNRVATLSQLVARQLRLSDQEVDHVRVAALLQDLNEIEVTAQVIHRAFGDLTQSTAGQSHTFHGGDLLRSLGSVLTGALPMVVAPLGGTDRSFAQGRAKLAEAAFGAAIIQSVNRFDSLIHGSTDSLAVADAIRLMRSELDSDDHPAVLHALGQVILDLPTRATNRLDALENLVNLELRMIVERPTTSFD